MLTFKLEFEKKWDLESFREKKNKKTVGRSENVSNRKEILLRLKKS